MRIDAVLLSDYVYSASKAYMRVRMRVRTPHWRVVSQRQPPLPAHLQLCQRCPATRHLLQP
jgi:hypothetical protein